MGTVTGRACIFCGHAPVTKEHLFPIWMGKELRAHHTLWRPEIGSNLLRGSHGESARHIPADILDTTASRVCFECNTGWMNGIETSARPYLELMINGIPVELHTEAQRSVATWAALKTVIGGYVHTPPLPDIDSKGKAWLSSKHTIPDTWQVWMTAYRGRESLCYEQSNAEGHLSRLPGRPIVILDQNYFKNTPALCSYEGVVATFVIGYLALKVFRFHPLRVGNAWPKVFLSIAPQTPPLLRWPPHEVLTDKTLRWFFNLALRDPSDMSRHVGEVVI